MARRGGDKVHAPLVLARAALTPLGGIFSTTPWHVLDEVSTLDLQRRARRLSIVEARFVEKCAPEGLQRLQQKPCKQSAQTSSFCTRPPFPEAPREALVARDLFRDLDGGRRVEHEVRPALLEPRIMVSWAGWSQIMIVERWPRGG